jgi:peptidoglycan hydrolase-like protein with peptidoglycan-binding domain
MQRGDRGPHVATLQRELAALGYQPGPADGICGPRTLAAYEAYERAKAHGVTPRMGAHPRAAKQGERPWGQVTGITLHQTAVDLGERPARWDGLRAHVGVTRGGQILQVYGLSDLVYHGHGLNGSTVGIELSGTYEGVEGDPRTWWQPPGVSAPQRPTAALVEAARRAVRWVVEEVAAHGGRVRWCYAHRQSRASRVSDPCKVLWREVALEVEREGLLETRPGFTVGTGRPIPREWDARSPHSY